MRSIVFIFVIGFITGCSGIPAPGILTPDLTRVNNTDSFGDFPEDYQLILKKYLIKNIKNHKEARVEFVNTPQKLSITHLGNSYAGYRICLSINEKKGDYYKGYKNHLFIINKGQINLHLFDSGLLEIPFEYCVTRDESKAILVEDIPEDRVNEESISKDGSVPEKEEKITIDQMDKIDPIKSKITNKNNIFILCKLDKKVNTYVFNTNKNSFYKADGSNLEYYSVSFNEAFINASNDDQKIKINRVSGRIDITSNNDILSGDCELLDKTKF